MYLGQEVDDGGTKWKVCKFYEIPSENGEISVDPEIIVNNAIDDLKVKPLGYWKANTEYNVGDRVNTALDPFIYFECVVAGTSDAGLSSLLTLDDIGSIFEDGTVKWLMVDKLDGTPIGQVIGSMYLKPGYIQANGATVLREDYPRLVALADKYFLWTEAPRTQSLFFGIGDGSTTMILPDFTNKIKYFTDDSEKINKVKPTNLVYNNEEETGDVYATALLPLIRY